jgi:hypothetical protein
VTALAVGVERRAALGGLPLRRWDAPGRVSDHLDSELDETWRGPVGRTWSCLAGQACPDDRKVEELGRIAAASR